MKLLKTILKWLPEIILILITLYYWIDTGNIFNRFAIGFIIFLVVHIVLNKKIIGIILSLIFSLLSTYLFLAWYSDVVKIKTYDEAAKEFILFGLIFIGIMMAMSLWILGRSLLSEHRNTDLAKI